MRDLDYYFVPMIFFILIAFAISYGVHTDHIYKMKRLELIEKGIIKE